jgi:neutral ceramidase
MGHSFVAGTVDGVGITLAHQGTNNTAKVSRILGAIGRTVRVPQEEDVKCHSPKPILLDTGNLRVPYRWQPKILPVQMFVLGRQFVILGLPSEVTTMAGRRLREGVLRELSGSGVVDEGAVVAIAAISNTYSSYVTTREEVKFFRLCFGSMCD